MNVTSISDKRKYDENKKTFAEIQQLLSLIVASKKSFLTFENKYIPAQEILFKLEQEQAILEIHLKYYLKEIEEFEKT